MFLLLKKCFVEKRTTVFGISAKERHCVNFQIRDSIMFSMGPEFDSTVVASFNEMLVKSTPSTSRILSIFFNRRLAADALLTSSTKIPC